MSNTKEAAEDEWIQIIKAKKDPRAFEPLYIRHYDSIFRFIFNRVQEEQITADLTSQVFLKAISKLDSYSYRGIPFASWLFRIAYNQCMEYFRKRSGSQYVILDEEFHEVLIEEEPDQDAFDKIQSAIQKLSKEEVALIQMRFYESLSFRLIADILEISENNAKVKLHRIIKKIRKHLPS